MTRNKSSLLEKIPFSLLTDHEIEQIALNRGVRPEAVFRSKHDDN